MNRDETKALIRTMMSIWPNFHPNNLSDTVTIWSNLLSDLGVKETMTALRGIAQTSQSEFAPTVAQLRKAVEEARKIDRWSNIKTQLIQASYGRLLE